MILLKSKLREVPEEEKERHKKKKLETERMIFVIINGKVLIAYLQPQSVYICRLVCLDLFSIAEWWFHRFRRK